MRKEFERDFAVLALTIVTLVVISNKLLLSQTIDVQNYQLSLGAIVTAILIIIINLVKSNKKLAVIYQFNRTDIQRLLTLFVYYFYIFSFIILFTYNHSLHYVIALILIIGEMSILVLSLLMRLNNVSITSSKKLFVIKDSLFFIMLLILALQNMPFLLYSIPADLILVSMYTSFVAYLTYLLVNVLYKAIKY